MMEQLVPKCWDPGYKHLSSFQEEEQKTYLIY